jgi:hypothetical protein
MSHTIQIQLRPEVEAQLAAEAEARGMALEHYIVERLAGTSPRANGRNAVSEAIDRIHQLRKGNRLDGLGITELIHEGRKY